MKIGWVKWYKFLEKNYILMILILKTNCLYGYVMKWYI